FDRLIGLGPQEIQVGILKRLRGTPIARHDGEWRMVYSAHAPYEILQNKLISFAEMQRLRRFAKYWELVGNSGNFAESAPLIWREASPFLNFIGFSDWLFAHIGRTDSIALARLMELLFRFLTEERRLDSRTVAEALWRDYQRGGRRDKPPFLVPFLADADALRPSKSSSAGVPRRQARHAAPQTAD
ncbi:MAG TPA: DUF4080 domain-containing protein, partial [Candidatus Acidoferrum sp.]|nr:DUF4080 domain-containing protein [Candidatus Acidoferrum sp.]